LQPASLKADDDLPDACGCPLGTEFTCDLGDCNGEPDESCCQVIVIPVVNSGVYYLIIAGCLLGLASVTSLRFSGFYKSQYSALQKLSRKIRNFW